MINWQKRIDKNGFPETLKLYIKFYNLDVDVKIINRECHIIHVYLQQCDLEKVRNWINYHKTPGGSINYHIVDEIKIKEFMKPIGMMSYLKKEIASEVGISEELLFKNFDTVRDSCKEIYGKISDIPQDINCRCESVLIPKPSILSRIKKFYKDKWLFASTATILILYAICMITIIITNLINK